ncbi:MAG TPA: peptidylprolyl isomerase [Candidatus Dormibacteraeota bacterium]|nr:peptidylprolyl isomerase [Candidatus Dormibacteraeota bacterium]
MVYVLECADGSLYTGWSNDLARRIHAHLRGTASRATRGRRPLRLRAWWQAESAASARSTEARFKQLGRAGKLTLLASAEAFGYRVIESPTLTPTTREDPSMAQSPPQEQEREALLETARTSIVRITTPKGEMTLALHPDDAPMHSAAFVKLVQAGFYDGLTFHRVEPNFVIQGGCPDGDGTGGPGYRLKAEFNKRPHVRGTLAMARSSSPDSAGSQFYICLDDARFLDGQYTVFGQLTDGFETLDAIRRGDVMTTVTLEPKPAA